MLDFLINIGKTSDQINQIASELLLAGMTSANVPSYAKSYTIAVLNSITNYPILFLTSDDQKAEAHSKELRNYVENYYLPQKQVNESPQISSIRLRALNKLSKKNNIICSSINILEDTFTKKSDITEPLKLKINQEINLNSLAKTLVKFGYTREYQVGSPAQFSIRGNICDIYSTLKENPFRLEFFANTIEDIRSFNHLNQRSIKKLNNITINPASFKHESASLIKDYLTDNCLIVFDDFQILQQKHMELNIRKYFSDFSSLDLSQLSKKSHTNKIDFEKIEFEAGEFEKLKNFLEKKQRHGYLTVLNIKEKGKRERLKEMLASWSFFSEENRANLAIIKPLILINDQEIDESFILPSRKIAVISDNKIFVRNLENLPEKIKDSNVRISSFEDLEIDDFVVHISHGIARYKGLETKEIDGIKRAYMKLAYAGADKLFVPVTEIDRVSRYIGATEKEPAVSKLNSSKWAQTKKKVQRSVQKLAIDLLGLHAKRAQVKGYKFGKDTPWQRQLEDDFPFEETKGQMSAIKEVKQDQEQYKPMDRLVCGDVGYGKTEVALRAAFKVALESKQVLVLVPTTILAQQHFNTFSSRLNPYPVIINMLSRFKTKSEQAKIVEDFNNGTIDILIGTHRLLQKDIAPKDLGLIIVDEEQRFGVAHKEKIKTLKTNVDILTLSATPIPRTLQMALSGIRSLSLIETPPDNRHPVITYVNPYETLLAVEAIRKEIDRGGQVFYLYNKVQTIEKVANKIKELVPDAKIGIAHGQLKERTLEKIMLDFIGGNINVLVTTTIIESGIDVSKANTLIVDNAENFGLAQLYQIRGRVGRSAKQAYAYLFYRTNLTSNAIERLKTLSDYTSLGSGYKIALRDLEIRGAGNLLGAEQSGHIAAVGFDLYTHLLQNAVDELKGAKPEKRPKERDLPVSAYIPKSYINDEALRIDFYQRLAYAKKKTDFEEIIKEIKDRFGPLPKEVENLRTIGLLKFKKT